MPGIVKRAGALTVNRRVQVAVVSNAAVSISSLLLTVAVARKSTTEDFGEFAMAMVAYLLASGVVRAAVTDTALARAASVANRDVCYRRASLLAMVMGGTVIGVGLLAGNGYLVLLGVSLHGLLTLDYVRVVNTAAFRPATAWWTSATWSAAVVAVSLVVVVTALPPWWAFVGWCLSGCAIGYAAATAARYPLRPGWPRDREATRAAGWFSLDFLAGSGGSALSTSVVGATLGVSIVGALRGAATLLGPAALVASTSRSLAIPYLVRSRGVRPQSERHAAMTATAALTVVALPLVLAVVLVPDWLGTALLGASWALAAPILLPMGLESLAAMIGSVPSAGHRAAFAGRRALVLRLAVGVPRPVIVLIAGVNFGASGVAWAMAAIAVVNAILWWASYLQLGPSSTMAPAR